MSSSLRISIIMVLVLATAALGLIAYNASLPRPVAEIAAQAAPAAAPTDGYYVATRALPAGTFVRDEDFQVRAARPGELPAGAISDSADAKIQLRGSLVRNYIDAGRPITAQDVLRPRDRGFLANVLAPDTRAISINVDTESGVSGLIWPGDYVDVVLTQTADKADQARHSLSETLLQNVRVIAIDQEIAVAASGPSAAAGKATRSVSLQLSPDQVKRIALAKNLGKLSLAVRSAVEVKAMADSGTMFGCDVSPAIARQNVVANQNSTVLVYGRGKLNQYLVRNQGLASAGPASACDGSAEVAHPDAAPAASADEQAKE